jgi:tRNA1(Val) A37 N6-methylase TrmN6
MPAESTRDITEDAVLGGRLRLRQPRKGHRFGHDAVLLAAATAARPGEHVVELGAGVGAAGLVVASRCPLARVTLAEIDPDLVALAQENIAANALGNATAMALDVTAGASALAEAGLPAGCANRVLMNPPFGDPARHRPSPDARRRVAHLAESDTLPRWVASARHLLAPSGVLTLIWRADALATLLPVLEPFGAIAVLPVHPRPGSAAIRVLVRVERGSRAPLSLEPGLVLADGAGRPSDEAEAVLRQGTVLPLAER